MHSTRYGPVEWVYTQSQDASAERDGFSFVLLVPVPLTLEDRRLARRPSVNGPSTYHRHPAHSKTFEGWKWSFVAGSTLPGPLCNVLSSSGPLWKTTVAGVNRVFSEHLATRPDPYSLAGFLDAGMVPIPCCICCQPVSLYIVALGPLFHMFSRKSF